MSKFDFRILLETVEGVKTSYMSQSFADTSKHLVLSASQVYNRITGSVSSSYQNKPFFSSSVALSSTDIDISKTFKDNTLLSASLQGGVDTGSIKFTAINTDYDRLLRYKFFGEKVCNVLGLPNAQWVYVDQFRLPADDEANFIEGNIRGRNAFFSDTVTFANTANVNSDIPFLIDTGSDRYVKFVDERNIPTVALRMGYDVDTDSYELTGSSDFTFNIGDVNNLRVADKIIHQDDEDTNIQFVDDRIIFNVGDISFITLTNSPSSQDIITFGEGTDLDFRVRTLVDSNAIFVEGSSGNIGFGTNAPTTKLQVAGDISASGNIIGENYIVKSTVTEVTTSFSSGSTIFGDTPADDRHEFTGSVFISGSNGLDIVGDISINNITASGNISASGYISSSGITISKQGDLRLIGGANDIIFGQPGDAISANYGIKTDGNLFLDIDKDNDNTGNFFQFRSNAAINSLMRINDTGEVGIGTTAPTTKLQVEGSISSSGDIHTLSHITASGDISSSGTITAQRIDLSPQGLEGAGGYAFGGRDDTGMFENSFNIGIVSPENVQINIDSNANDTDSQFAVVHHNETVDGSPANPLFQVFEDGRTLFSTASVAGVTINHTAGHITASGNISGSLTSTIEVGGEIKGDHFLASDQDDGYHFGDSSVALQRANNSLEVKYSSTVAQFSNTIGLNLTGHITASGNISASGTVFADSFQSATGGSGIDFNDSLDLTGNITASGNISASGIITGEGLVISDDAEIADDLTVKGTLHVTSSTDPNLILEDPNGSSVLRFRRTDQNKNIDLSMEGNDLRIISTDNDGSQNILIGVSAGSVKRDNRLGIGQPSPSEALDVSGSMNISGPGNITASGDISGSGTGSFSDGRFSNKVGIGGATAPTTELEVWSANEQAYHYPLIVRNPYNNNAPNINYGVGMRFHLDDASEAKFGAIAYEANTAYGNNGYLRFYVDGNGVTTTPTGSNADMTLDSGGNITASGDISSSGTITTDNYGGNISGSLTSTGSFGELIVADDATITDRLTVGGVANFNGSFVNIGGGFGSTGVSIAADGDIQTNGTLEIDGNITSSGKVGIGTLGSITSSIHIANAQGDVDAAFRGSMLTLTPTSLINDDGFTGITMETSTNVNGYGISMGARRYRTDGKPAFVLHTHNNNLAGTERFRIQQDGLISFVGNITGSGNISASGTLTSNGVNSSAAVLPVTSNGAALGSTSLQWSDLFLASGGVINFNNGDITLTHSAGSQHLKLAGGNFNVDGHITASGNISGSLTSNLTIGGIANVNQLSASNGLIVDNNISASGHITASKVNAGTQLRFDEPATAQGHGMVFPVSSLSSSKVSAIQWDFPNDDAFIYAHQSSSDNMKMVFECRDNVVTDEFVFWFNNFAGSGSDAFPLAMRGDRFVVNNIYDKSTTYHRDPPAINMKSNNVDFYLLKSGSTTVSEANSLIFGDVSAAEVTMNGALEVTGNISASLSSTFSAGTGSFDKIISPTQTTNKLILEDDQSLATNMVSLMSVNFVNLIADGNNNGTGKVRILDGNYDADSATEVAQFSSEAIELNAPITASGNITSSGFISSSNVDASTGTGSFGSMVVTDKVQGNLTVDGILFATRKSFLINKPEGGKLEYGSLEGPQNDVFHRGELKGDNVIYLPKEWKWLVDENTITTQLTSIGKHQELFVKEIKDNKIFIDINGMFKTKENIHCYYIIHGTRKDIELIRNYE